MPAFKEYVAKGKLTPTDMGFTAFETAARRQQSFTADQVANIEKSSKAVSQAWEGTLKFGLDELELTQHSGGGGVKAGGGGKVERTLIGTGSSESGNWNAKANVSNEVGRGARDLTSLARGLNNRVAPPITAADGIVTGPGNQRIIQLQNNPQMIPLGPGDINLRRLNEYGINPQKQIIAEPLSANPNQMQDIKMGSVAGLQSARDINQPNVPFTELPQGAPLPKPVVTPLSKSGTGIWDSIFGTSAPTLKTPPITGYDKKGNPTYADTPSGYDAQGNPFYTFPGKDKGEVLPPTPTDTSPAPASDVTAPPDTDIPSPALLPSAVDSWNPQ